MTEERDRYERLGAAISLGILPLLKETSSRLQVLIRILVVVACLVVTLGVSVALLVIYGG